MGLVWCSMLSYGLEVGVFESVLVVCVGNVCRSPSAEVMFRHAFGKRSLRVASAGLGAMVGRDIDASAQELLLRAGLNGSGHRARQLDGAMLAEADLVLVMERSHLHHVAAISPQTSGKTFLLGKWQEERGIPDPYRQPLHVFEHVHQLMAEGVEAWSRHI